MIPYNRKLKNTARTLRKNMTDSEKRLWLRIRRKQPRGFQFYRQKVIGDFIVDFYCPSARIVVEVDGGQHFEEIQKRMDEERDAYLTELGFQVLRFPSWDVMRDLDRVVDEIWDRLEQSESPSVPFAKGVRRILIFFPSYELGGVSAGGGGGR